MRTYTRAQIQTRRTDLIQLPEDIQTIQKELIRLNANLKNLKIDRDQRQSEYLEPLTARIHAAEARILVLDLPPQIERLRGEIASEQEILRTLRRDRDNLTAQIQPIEELIRKLIFAKEIRKAERENQELDTILRRQRDIVASCDSDLSILNSRLSSVESSLSSAQISLSNYKSQQQQANANIMMAQAAHHHGHDGYHSSFGGGMYSSSMNQYAGEISVLEGQINGFQNDISSLRLKIGLREAERITAVARRNEADRELRTNLSIIANNKAQLINFDYGSLADIQYRIDERSRVVEPLIAQRKGLINNIATHEAREKTLTADMNDKARTLQTARSNDTTYTHQNKNEIVNTLNQLKRDIAPHNEDQRVTQEGINQTQTEITNQERTLAAKQKLLKEHIDNAFLAAFDANPLLQLNTLRNRIFEALSQYERDNLKLDDKEVRRCIYEYQTRMEFIVGTQEDQLAENPEQHRTRLEHLTGYIWSLSDRNYADKQLKQIILNALGKEALDKKETTDLYNAYALAAPAQLRPYTDADIDNKEDTDYDNAYNAFRDALAQAPQGNYRTEQQLYRTGRNLLKSINDVEGDKAYRTQLLTAGHALLVGYHEPANHTRLHHLANLNTHGVRSIPKIVCGALMMFLGVAGIAACIGLAVATYGIASPFMIAGIVASAAVFAGGLTLMLNGLNKGVQRNLNNFEKAAQKANQDPALRHLRQQGLFHHRPVNPGYGTAPVLGEDAPSAPLPEASAPPADDNVPIYRKEGFVF